MQTQVLRHGDFKGSLGLNLQGQGYEVYTQNTVETKKCPFSPCSTEIQWMPLAQNTVESQTTFPQMPILFL